MSETTQTPLKVSDITIVSNAELKKVISASCLGNAVEWFDFSVYGFLAVIIGQTFFSEASQSVQMIASLATFSIPFLFRPLGGAVFGYFGDKYGRKNILAITIVMMSLSTFAIGIIPSYSTIGILAPILLILAKVIQGLSVGGEYAGAVVFVGEYSPDRKRGFLASWLDFGSIAGFLLGALVVSIISALIGQEALASWGWRIPFLISLPLGAIGLFLRHSLEESPAYEAQTEEDRDNSSPVMDIIRNNYKNIIICCLLVISTNTTYYMLLTYMPNYLSANLHYSYDHGNLIIIIVMVFMLFVQPLVGFMSDKVGRKPFLFFGSIALFVMAYPAFWLIQQHDYVLFIAGGLAVLALILCCFIGVMASILPALFPTEVRFRTLAICFNVSVFVAGLTPPLAAWLVDYTGSLYMPAYYLMVISVLGFISAIAVHETANRPLKDATPIASNKQEAKEVLQDHFDHIETRVEAIEDKITNLEEKKQTQLDNIEEKISNLEELKLTHADNIEEKISNLEEERQNLVDQHPKLT